MADKAAAAHTGVLFGQIVVVCTVAGACVWAGTQYTAAALGYSPRLGPSAGHIGNLPVYYPWQLFMWWYAYEAYAPDVFIRGGVIASMGGVLGAGTAVAMSVQIGRAACRERVCQSVWNYVV